MNTNFLKRALVITYAILILFSSTVTAQKPPKLTPEEFSGLIAEISEESGYFRYDNWVSNELSHQHVLDPLKEYNVKGGVYLGVGPNQNFTYIANIKPDLAFIMDIRRDNMLQHLVWKVAFEQSETRAEFFSFLFARPLDKKIGPTKDAGIDGLIEYFNLAPQDSALFNKNMSIIMSTLRDKYKFQFIPSDERNLRRIYRFFYNGSLDMTYTGNTFQWFPTYARFMALTDQHGVQRNSFNFRKDYLYLRKMHLENRLIPCVGNFGGTKALRSIARYLKEHDYTVTAYYVSNVEQYVMRDYPVWRNWVENVKSLPLTDNSVFIRWTYHRGYYYGQTRLQYIKKFIDNYDAGNYYSYQDLVYLDYIK
jgi:hypothetical protein